MLLEKYAQDILDTEPPPASASDDEFGAWRAQVRERAGTLIGEVRRDDEPDRKQIARQLAGLPDRERVWGRDAGAKGRDAGAKGRDAGAKGRDAGAKGRDAGTAGTKARGRNNERSQ